MQPQEHQKMIYRKFINVKGGNKGPTWRYPSNVNNNGFTKQFHERDTQLQYHPEQITQGSQRHH